jgi:hypothetical protein
MVIYTLGSRCSNSAVKYQQFSRRFAANHQVWRRRTVYVRPHMPFGFRREQAVIAPGILAGGDVRGCGSIH